MIFHRYIPRFILTQEQITALTNIAFNTVTTCLITNHSLLDRPTTDTTTQAPKIEFLPPLFNLVTSKYDDMHVLLNTITLKYFGMHYYLIFDISFEYNTCTENNHYNVTLLFGDEQLVSRLLHIMKRHSTFYGNILPFPGLCCKNNLRKKLKKKFF